MSLIKQLGKVSNTQIAKSSSISEANIIAGQAGTYTIRLRDGTKAVSVPGPTTLQVGDSVTVARYAGKVGKYVILQKGYKSDGRVTTIYV
jgi:hypothetical protein